MKYIHYGHKTFEPDRFQKVENQLGIPKPNGGLWASPIETEYGWKEWNANKNIGASFEEYFMFTLKKDAKVLTISNVEQLGDLPQLNSLFPFNTWALLDYEKLAEEYDAIEVKITEDGRLYEKLYTWDCDSILIINPDVIELDK